jgi:glycosyltransferase involved in cell wall biosynthesis
LNGRPALAHRQAAGIPGGIVFLKVPATANRPKDTMNLILFSGGIGYGGLGRILSEVSCRLPDSVSRTIVLMEDRVAYPYRGTMRILGENCLKRLPIKGLRLLLNALKFRRVVREIRPDAVLCFNHDARAVNFLAKMTLPCMRYRTVIAALGVATQYEKYFAGSRKRLHRLLVFLLLRHADRIIAITDGVRSDLISGFQVEPGKIEVVYGSVDFQKALELASEAVDHPWFGQDVPIVALSGRLVFEKNHADLLKAFAIVRKQKSCRLAFVGDGPEQSALENMARNLGVASDVLFLGYQKNPFKFVARSSVFAFPSLFEAQGLVLIEAMAVGCPVAAYDCPVGPREMLAPGTQGPVRGGAIEEAAYGLLVPTGNVELLAEAILRLLEDGRLHARYSRLGKERAAHFDAQKMADGYYRVLKQAVSKDAAHS